MSAMSDIDLMLQEYQHARENLRTSSSGHAPLSNPVLAAENVIRAADVLANGLRSILTANEPKRFNPMDRLGVDISERDDPKVHEG